MGLQEDVLLLGALSQEKVAELLPTAHCYVQPSVITPSGKMEGIPVALMEAYAAGLPVIATDISGIPELVRPGETGVLVPPGDAVALANAIKDVYCNWESAKSMETVGAMGHQCHCLYAFNNLNVLLGQSLKKPLITSPSSKIATAHFSIT